MAWPLPKTRKEIAKIQSERKRVAVEQARRSPFWQKRLPTSLDLGKLDDPAVWQIGRASCRERV